jgi:hypothetical protein
MAALEVASNRDGFSLLIDRTVRPDYYRAELNCGAMHAAVEFYEMNIRPVGDFVNGLASAWRGWDGERTWGSLEGEVGLRASHDKLGTVKLAAELRSDVYASQGGGYLWTATALLFLDAGGLDSLARRAAELAA